MTKRQTLFSLGALFASALFFSAIGEGASATAKLGDPAPELEVSEWIKGGPVSLKEGKGKNVYLVEFWATWCPPCRQSIPHLTEIQKKYKEKGLIVVGITDEEAADVKSFIEKQGDKAGYAIGIDKDMKTGEAYMAAYGQEYIPHAFIVDKEGKIVFHENPLEKVLEAEIEKALNAKPKDEEKPAPKA